MKLHVAIREGMKKVNAGHYYFDKSYIFNWKDEDISVEDDRKLIEAGENLLDKPVYVACAIGTAYFGANGTPEDVWSETPTIGADSMVEQLRRRCGAIVDLEVEYPATEWAVIGTTQGYKGAHTMPMWAALEHLFEGAKWPRQVVADFVASYEDYNRK